MGAVYKNLADFLTQNKEAVISKWFHLLLEDYPGEASRTIKREKNQFANPVGHKIHQGIEGIYEKLIQGVDDQRTDPFLDDIIRVKAVQDFTPSQAVAFIFFLKKVVREQLKDAGQQEVDFWEELQTFDEKLDNLALRGFDIYTECKEKIYQLRINELNRNYGMLQRATMGRAAVQNKKE